MSAKTTKKDQILEATAQVVAEKGAAHLTIDAVAAKAGISKGGVLYHFPNKLTLLQGMLDRVIDTQQSQIAAVNDAVGVAHAHVLSVLQPMSDSDWASAQAVLAAAAEDPELMTNGRKYMRGIIDQLKNEPRFAQAMLAIIAAEGQRIMEALNILPLTDDERAIVHEKLLELAKASAS